MFVRWQLYGSQALNPLQRKHNDERARLKASLVESIRIDGKPRQKHIAFLGSTSIDGGDRRRFWYDVTTQLKRLGKRVSPADRKRIESALSKRVKGRLLNKAELAQFERDRRAMGLA